MINPDPRDFEWQRRYLENDTPWVEEVAAPPLTGYLREQSLKGRVLVPGCGLGQEVRALARQDECSALGLDLASFAISKAREFPFLPGKESHADYAVGDFLNLPANYAGMFDWVVEHTCFCAIHPDQRPAYVQAARAALKPGGKLFAIFFMTPERAVGPPFGSNKPELDRLFGDSFQLQEEWVPKEAFPDRIGRELVRIFEAK